MTIKLLLWAITCLVLAKTLWQLFTLWRAWCEWRRDTVMDAIIDDGIVVNPHNEFNTQDNVPF